MIEDLRLFIEVLRQTSALFLERIEPLNLLPSCDVSKNLPTIPLLLGGRRQE
jgi:hypothetical protein